MVAQAVRGSQHSSGEKDTGSDQDRGSIGGLPEGLKGSAGRAGSGGKAKRRGWLRMSAEPPGPELPSIEKPKNRGSGLYRGSICLVLKLR